MMAEPRPDLPTERTLADVWDLGTDEERTRLKTIFQEIGDALDSVDQDHLRLARTGAVVVSVEHGRLGDRRIWVDNYRTGAAYGGWSIERSPDGDKVTLTHYLPGTYLNDGAFDMLRPHSWWTAPADDFAGDPEGFLAEVMGSRLAHKVARQIDTA